MAFQRTQAPTVRQYPSKYIPPMFEAEFKDFPERLARAVMSASPSGDDLPPPLPSDAINEARDFQRGDETDRLHARFNRPFTRGGFRGSNRRPRNAQRNFNPRIMSARYAGTCAETNRAFSEGASILWVPADRQCFIEDSETYQDFLTAQREVQS